MKRAHELVLIKGNDLRISGVQELVEFAADSVTLELEDEMRLHIDGRDLRIKSYIQETGEITISGIVRSIIYPGLGDTETYESPMRRKITI